jgi:hypothetical protein
VEAELSLSRACASRVETDRLGDQLAVARFGQRDGDVSEGIRADVEGGAGKGFHDHDLHLVGGIGIGDVAEALHHLFGVDTVLVLIGQVGGFWRGWVRRVA